MKHDPRPARSFLFMLLVAAAILSLAVTDASARTEARYLLRTPDAYFGNDLYASRSIQDLFHQQTLFQSDTEHYDLSMPAFDNLDLSLPGLSNSLDAGPTSARADGISATANVLPFGLVNLAFPSIHEDSDQVTAASQTGFLSANYNYRSETDYGNIPVSPAYPSTLTQVMQPAPLFGWSQLYPEQFGAIAVQNKINEAGTVAGTKNASSNQSRPSNQTASNQTSSNVTATNQTDDTIGTWLNQEARNSTGMISVPGDKFADSIDYFKAKNASWSPQQMPVIYPSVFDMAGKTVQTFPSNGIGGTFTNGGGSTGATFLAGTSETGTAGNNTGNATGTGINRSIGQAFTTTTAAGPSDMNYADFNFDATTQQINGMSLLERMWRNSHRGGTMGKAYAGPTDAPYWIDPYIRPYDVSMIDEHWYVLQCALNMTQPGTQILPRLWSLMW